jgi:hypothetical protein
LLAQSAVAASAGGAGVLLLLVLGTQIFDWQWPVAVFLAVLAFGVYRVRRARVPLYRTAQSLDHSLGLADRLSTAYYFRRVATAKSPDLVDTVEAQAIRSVQAGDVERAMPMRFPTAGYVACALAVAAVSLIAVRYGVLKTLSLERPLANINFDTFTAPPKVQAATSRKSVVQEHLEKQLAQLGLTPEELQLPMEKSGEKPNATNVSAISEDPGGAQKTPPGMNAGDPIEGAEENKDDDQPSGPNASESKDGASGQQSPGQKGQASTTPPKAPPKPGGNSPNPGVLDKMKDAFANLLNKLGNQQGEKGQESASEQQGQQKAGTQQQAASEKGTQGQGKAQGDNQPSPDAQGKDSEGGEQTPGQQQRASQQEGAKGANENSKSGMGKSDGDKTIQDAEQLAAMGKISEIFGKRAADMKGEMSVEVPAGKQQLRTAYSKNAATHTGAVADANRNEIPLAYQPYVQRYFEEIRKATAAKTPPAAAKP